MTGSETKPGGVQWDRLNSPTSGQGAARTRLLWREAGSRELSREGDNHTATGSEVSYSID